MKKIGKLLILKLLCVFTLVSPALAQDSLKMFLPISNFLEGESGKLHVITEGVGLSDITRSATVDGVEYKLESHFPVSRAKNGLVRNVYSFSFQTSAIGTFKTPAFEVEINGKKSITEQLKFHVHSADQFKVKEIKLGNNRYSYLSATFTEQAEAYENQSIKGEIRYILPSKLNLSQWGVADADHDTSLFVWKPLPPERLNRHSPYAHNASSISINGVSYIGAAYQSTLFGLNSGTFNFGPIVSNSVFQTSTSMSFGMFKIASERANLVAGIREIKIKPLPPGAPPTFNGNVGSFGMVTSEPKDKSITLDESIKISLTVSGKGNFLTLKQPQVIDTDTWEVIDFSESVSADTQESIQNSIQYDFLISPKKSTNQTPQITFDFFDPETSEYHQILSERFPIEVNSKNLSQSALGSPATLNQQDILGLIEIRSGVFSSPFKLSKYWHLLPASLFLSILAVWSIQKLQSRRLLHTETIARKQIIKKLQQDDLSKQEFLKRAGGLVEKWSGSTLSEDAQSILTERDRECFQPDTGNTSSLDQARKSQVMSVLRKLCIFILCVSFINTSDADSTQKFSTESFQQKLQEYKKYKKNSADLFYNMGVCYYKLNQPGKACLYFHRALSLDETHPEAKQNLQFLSTSLMHPSVSEPKKISKYIAFLSKTTYKDLCFLGLWGLIIGTTLLFCIRLGSRCKLAAFILIFICSIVAISSFTAYTAYPKSVHFAPLAELGVVTSSGNVLLTEPRTPLTEDDKIILIDVPEGSLCRVLNESAAWYYIELPSVTRGWILSKSILMVQEPDQVLPE